MVVDQRNHDAFNDMAKSTTPIVKRSRRLGIILGKEKYVRNRMYPPGVHGPKYAVRKPRLSSYGTQLMEKQKAKALYGVLEKQFRRYFEEAEKKEGNTASNLISRLELRLDNVIYRLGFAKTRRQARQMVNHKFFEVNGTTVNIPSYKVKVGDEIVIRANKKEKGLLKEIAEHIQSHETPKWLSKDAKTVTGKVTSLPQDDDVEKLFDPKLIVEFYSR